MRDASPRRLHAAAERLDVLEREPQHGEDAGEEGAEASEGGHSPSEKSAAAISAIARSRASDGDIAFECIPGSRR